ncbi:signal peptidase I [bacterium]|nr:signal peptidase I [bacterium]
MPATEPSHLNELRRSAATTPQDAKDDSETAAARNAAVINELAASGGFYSAVTQAAQRSTADPFESALPLGDRDRPIGETTTRHILESFLCLAIAVIVFRCFVLEGYIISTGSMAPTLLGYHKRVECPDCGFRFAVGVAFDDGASDSQQSVRCPNCGQQHIDASHVPRNSGDQLLVFKEAFAFRDPNRWEIAVFLNPNDPTQAYVKRTIGRPGEKVQIHDGDVFINDERARKPYATQRSLRIPVFDDAHYPQLDRAFARWLPEPGWTHETAESEYHFSPRNKRSLDSGRSPVDAPHLDPSFSWVSYFNLDRMQTRGRPNLAEEAVTTIAAGGLEADGSSSESRQPGPITDEYGYNAPSRSREKTSVHDLMLNCRVAFPEGRGEFAAVIRNRSRYAAFRLDRVARQAAVWISGRSAEHAIWLMESGKRPLVAAHVSPDAFDEPVEIDVSTFDRQLIVGLNAEEVLSTDLDQPLDGFSSPETDDRTPELTSGRQEIVLTSAEATDLSGVGAAKADAAGKTVQFGARGGAVDVTGLCLYRDVHYTDYDYRHGVKVPVQLGDDQFFFLGDNSPVSLDSRGWKSPTVARRLIVGRPLVVHLPSKPGELHFAGQTRSIRVPDFSRMRYVR